ncbi:MAG TPA: hypothetical protein VN962_22120 [Polyangia bacterium]|nr:hypothetical protein [Polyangia bacterium]
MPRRQRAWAFVAVLGASALTCGGGPEEGPIPVAELHDQFLAAACRDQVLCGGMPDETTCLASLQEEPHFFASLPQLVAQGSVRYDGAKARRCLDQLNARTSCARHVVDAPGALADCHEMLVGQVPEGGDCLFREECQSDGSCLPSDPGCNSFGQCCPGTCTTGSTLVPVGGDCTATTTVCALGGTCVRSEDGLSAACQPLVSTVGGSCASLPCVASLYCEPNTHTCQAPVPEGGACDPALGGFDCDDLRDRCDSTGHCSPRLQVRAACSTSDTACVPWATCAEATSTCVPLPGVGEGCNPTAVIPRCLGGANCDATTSVCTLAPAGDSCF